MKEPLDEFISKWRRISATAALKIWRAGGPTVAALLRELNQEIRRQEKEHWRKQMQIIEGGKGKDD